MKNDGLNIFLITIVLWSMPVYSQVTIYGAKGQLRVFDAETVPAGNVYISSSYSFYAEKANAQIVDDQNSVIRKKRELLNDHTVNINLTLGISKVFEFFIHAVPYQDNQRDLWGPVGDTQLGLKVHVPKRGGMMQYGFLGFLSIPTAPRHNIPFESFSIDAYGWGVLGLVNFDLKSTTINLPVKFCLNAGYRDHNWRDDFFASRDDQIFTGLGFKFPIRSALLYTEVTSEIFFNDSDSVAFSQNHFLLSQGVRFVALKDFIFDIGFDFRFGAANPTIAERGQNQHIKPYADWRVHIGAVYRLDLFSYRTDEETELLKQQKKQFEKSEEIRKQREKIGKELEELRKNIEKDKEEKPLY